MRNVIEFEALHNVRDLGGIESADSRPVRSGLLFRGDQPYSMTDADKRKVAALGVRKVIDLRSIAEHQDKPDPEIEGVENLYLPVIQDVRAGITHGEEERQRIGQMLMSGNSVDPQFVYGYMQNMYRQFVNDDYANSQYARFVDEVLASAQAGDGVLWHCTAGKDRAGFAAVILLEALGANRDDIIDDYLLTNDCLRGFVEGLLGQIAKRLSPGADTEALTRFFYADESYLAAAYDEAEQRFGSFNAYLEQAIGIDASKRTALRQALLA